MARTYYQIELTARQLTLLLVILAALLVGAFVLGYAAAWTAHGEVAAGPAGGPSRPRAIEEVVIPSPTPEAAASPVPTRTATPVAAVRPSPTARPRPTAGVRKGRPQVPGVKRPLRKPGARLWVQLLAARHAGAIKEGRRRAKTLGFPPDHQEVVRSVAEAGNVLYKLRVGPFPDRASADRVARRLRAEGFPDAWVVTP